MSIRWMNKQMLVCSFGGILFLTNKNNLLIEQHGRISESIMLSRRSQTHKNMWNYEKSKLTYKDRKYISGHLESRVSLEKGIGELFRVMMVVVLYRCIQLSEMHWIVLFIIFIFWLHSMACRMLVPQRGIKLVPLAVKAQSPNHWTARKFPELYSLNGCLLSYVNYTTTELIFFKCVYKRKSRAIYTKLLPIVIPG